MAGIVCAVNLQCFLFGFCTETPRHGNRAATSKDARAAYPTSRNLIAQLQVEIACCPKISNRRDSEVKPLIGTGEAPRNNLDQGLKMSRLGMLFFHAKDMAVSVNQ